MNDTTRSARNDSDSPEATAAFAATLGAALGAGDTLLLEGPVGAGKTHFARALIQSRLAAAGAAVEDVPSPTFTLVQTYVAGPLEIWHADLYRLSDPEELWELGLDTAFEDCLCLVEWPERLGRMAPPTALTLTIAPKSETSRQLTLSGPAARIADLIATTGGALAPV